MKAEAKSRPTIIITIIAKATTTAIIITIATVIEQ